MVEEIWLPIIGFESSHEISNHGRVRSSKHKRILIATINENGYPRIGFNVKGKHQAFYIHRLVAWHFIPNPENKLFVNHKTGNKLDCGIWELEWTTRRENQDHANKYGLTPKLKSGLENVRSKAVVCLNTGRVMNISDAAKELNTTRSNMCRWINGRRKNNTSFRLL